MNSKFPGRGGGGGGRKEGGEPNNPRKFYNAKTNSNHAVMFGGGK